MATTATKLGGNSKLKHPELMVGQTVIPNQRFLDNYKYHLKTYALFLIKQYRLTQRRIYKYTGGTKTGGRLPIGIKINIRNCLKKFAEAKSFEVAGIVYEHGFNLDSCDFNACYLAGVRGAASPPSYGIQLLIRFKNDNGNELALVTGCSFDSDSFRPIE